MPRKRKDEEEDTFGLGERGWHLFRSLVEHYINDGQPVSSRCLARGSGMMLSPATIRNVMADMEDLGLIRSPHTSAGRIPTVKGYRLFVDNMLQMEETLDAAGMQRLGEELGGKLETGLEELPEAMLQRVSGILSHFTQFAGVVSLPHDERRVGVVEHIEFVPLSGKRLLVVLIASDGKVENRVFSTERRHSTAELQRASNYLNSLLGGEELGSIRDCLLEELRRTRERVNTLLQQVMELTEQARRNRQGGDRYFITGQTNLMDVQELGDLEKLKRIFEVFSDKREMLYLLDRAIHAKGVHIFIGAESGYPVLDDCSMVTSTYQRNGKVVGVLGVIGPTRMHYERVIPVVKVTARMLSATLNLAPLGSI